MPLSVSDTFDLPYYAPPVRVVLEPARVAIQSLLMLTKGHNLASPADWVVNTLQAMTQEEQKTNNVVLNGLYYVVVPRETWISFPAYINHLSQMAPEALRDKMLSVYEGLQCDIRAGEGVIDRKTALASPENYLAFLMQRFKPEHIDEQIERQAYEYLQNPPALQRLVVDHLGSMWDKYLAAEWERVRPMLQQIVQAYRKLDLKGKSYLEAAELITGQDLDAERWEPTFAGASRVLFVPHPHVGPYLPKQPCGEGEVVVFFSAQLPDWIARDTPDLTRTEIFILTSALADDTRLRILRHIAQNGEQRSQEIMAALDLSQSAASRHLTQLSTAGFLTERRCEGAKCYALNPERITNTLQAIANFLLVKGVDYEYGTSRP